MKAKPDLVICLLNLELSYCGDISFGYVDAEHFYAFYCLLEQIVLMAINCMQSLYLPYTKTFIARLETDYGSLKQYYDSKGVLKGSIKYLVSKLSQLFTRFYESQNFYWQTLELIRKYP